MATPCTVMENVKLHGQQFQINVHWFIVQKTRNVKMGFALAKMGTPDTTPASAKNHQVSRLICVPEKFAQKTLFAVMEIASANVVTFINSANA